MTRIEQYLTGAIEIDALNDAEKCAICAAMKELCEAHWELLAPSNNATGKWLWSKFTKEDSYGPLDLIEITDSDLGVCTMLALEVKRAKDSPDAKV